MNQRHNSIIKFDLHIHSKASEYKEKGGIVENSTLENIATLLLKLDENNVSVFSITDHNRFDLELYLTVSSILAQPDNAYPNVKTILPGIEFDVKLDDDMGKCHIIAIFNAVNNENKLKQIDTVIKKHLLLDENAFYPKLDFENILKEIGIDTILIASQHKDINNHSGKHSSLSDTTTNVEEVMRIGYIDALEYQKPKVEGILLNNLKKLPSHVSLLSGSDCHDWSCYPYHDANNQNQSFCHSKAKMLSTFKGLLLAITSPETRFNCRDNTSPYFLSGFSHYGKIINLVKGVNAIIGENGSGKTTLLELINGKTIRSYVKELIENNKLKPITSIDPSEIKYIEQGQIIEKFNKKALFTSNEENNFKELNNDSFIKVYSDYAEKLYKCIELAIKKKQNATTLSQYIISYKNDLEASSYYINITCSKNFGDVHNPHDQPYKDINEIIDKINELVRQNYYQTYETKLTTIVNSLTDIQLDIKNKWKVLEYESKVKNIIYQCVQEYSRMTNEKSSTRDQEIAEYKKTRQKAIDYVIETIKLGIEDCKWPDNPLAIKGFSTNKKRGFNFIKKATYDGVSMLDDFYSIMFNKGYNNFLAIQNIISWDEFVEAVKNCTITSDIKSRWNDNFDKFIRGATRTTEYITDSTNQRVGSTLGEMSLSYYKYFTEDSSEWSVLIVDQPEDNISNNNINNKLISYFNSIRSEKQLIFVTHNPLLVVNLDVENIIFVKNENGKLSITDGCLEYEDEQTDILELIAQNMDGGKETIEKRLKVYGKKY